MVAIVTGNALGLNTSSLAVLGQQGSRGSASTGRNGEMAYVNAATGNLVLQTRDEMLVGRGLSVESLRTYNSRGQFTDDNGDNWSIGVYAQQLKLNGGTLNTSQSTFVRTDRDGAQATYTWDGGLQLYVNKSGGGAFDRIAATATSWTWTDGATGLRETYDTATGRLMTVFDRSGNTLTYGYDAAGQLISVTDANGEQTFYDYVGNQLRGVRTVIAGGTQTLTRVHYTYDDHNRLWKVKVDLTPEDNSIGNGKIFETTYTYDGDSKRVASIQQNNDVVLRVQYDANDRVQFVRDAFDKLTEYQYAAGGGRTTVVDPLGVQTVYDYDLGSGQLKGVSTMAGGSVLQSVSYQYNANGDVSTITDGQNNVTTFTYDSRGNQLSQRDAAGNTVSRTFNSLNQVVTESFYAAPNPTTSTPHGSHFTTRYIYDAGGRNQLRFVISPEGRITEHRYDAQGQRVATFLHSHPSLVYLYPVNSVHQTWVPTESQVASHVASSDWRKLIQRVDMVYDARGQLQKTTTYTATDANTGDGLLNGNESVTHYVYDQAGQLLETVSPTAGVTSIAYDGLGRVLTRVEPNGTTTKTTYLDASNTVEQTIAQTGLRSTSVYDKAGRLVSVQQYDAAALGLGERKYAYDANGRLLMTTDPTGVRQWMLYDEAGRKVADIDGNGSLVEYVYNRSGLLTRTTAYATAVSTAALVDGNGKPTAPALGTLRPATSALDRYQWNAYDKGGRLVKTVNGEGAVTETFYDGASRVVKVTQYFETISTAGLGTEPTPESIAPTPDTARDRTSRRFYDREGLLRAELDAEGYLVEYRYSVAGRRNLTVRYTGRTGEAQRAAGTLAELITSLGQTPPPSDSTYAFHDNKGQVLAEVDAANYLTEFEYDKNGNVKRQVRYHPALTAVVTTTSTVAGLKSHWNWANATPPAGVVKEQQVTTWEYDEFRRLTLKTDPDGTVTKFDYDAVGNLVRTTRGFGQGTEERALNARYDVQGRLVAELAATEAWRLTAGQSDAEVAAIFEQYGSKHAYDKAGRRISTTDRNGLATLFFYNEDSQLTFTVNAMGEVEERRYNDLGQLAATLRYGTRVGAGTVGNLKARLTTIAAEVAKIANAAKDDQTSYAYELSGLVDSATVSLKGGRSSVTRFDYNAFGQETDRWTDLDDGSGRVRHDESAFDRRGLVLRQTADAAGLRIDTQYQYDAFGRRTYVHDHNTGKFSKTDYDKLGRVVMVTDRLGQARRSTYDAFDRVLKQYDALDQVTEFTHNTASRSVEMKTPEGIKVTTVHNRHGQVLSITDGERHTTSYVYDRDGNLTDTIAPIASASTSHTFERGRLVETTDGNGVRVTYRYDDANRVMERELDPDGLKLLTKYEYDASGRQCKVTDPEGIVTLTEYELGGRVMTQTVDHGTGPENLNLVTQYVHDAAGNVLTVTSPGGKVTRYQYDALGRRTEELVDPDGLKLKTSYTYDHQGNVRARTEPTGAVTRYVYDAEGRLLLTVDGVGGVTRHEYDKNDRVTRVTRYAKEISLAGLPLEASVSDIEPNVVRTPGKDAVDARRYDRDGRLRYTVDGTGAVVEYRYDDNGNVEERIAYAKAIDLAAWTSGDPPVVASSGSDQRLRNQYDALNRLTYQADATGAVTLREYDDNGNLSRLTEYASKLDAGKLPSQVSKLASADRVSVFGYDSANREVWRSDPMGAVTKSEYDKDGNLLASTRYFNTVTPGTAPSQVGSHPQDRVTRYTYDGAGRRNYMVDALNYVTRWTYDDAVNRRTTTRFAATLTVGDDPQNVVKNAAADQVDIYQYDHAGRLLAHTDALNQTESYTYDTRSNSKTFTNKKGSVWRYEYDAAGRLVRETAPEVQLTSASADANGKLVAGTSRTVALKTFLEYDALGNLTRRTEAEGEIRQRATSYEYDARGRQVKVTYPAVMVHRETEARALTTQTFYDTLGNAVANVDVAGNTFYKAYDLAGRLRYEVDALGHVTGYERNVFGEAETLIRYAKPTDLPTSTTAAAVARMASAEVVAAIGSAVAPLDHALDRTLTTWYDQLGRVRETIEPEVYNFDGVTLLGGPGKKKTVNTYNAFGKVVKTRVSDLGETTVVDTFFYFDQLGRQKSQVDALGHLTVRRYDSAGNMLSSKEYARALDAGGWNLDGHGLPVSSAEDRETLWTYDQLNRKTSETRVGAGFVANADAIPGSGTLPGAADVVTEYGYDAVGNLTRTKAADGGTTFSYYDALGRVTAVVSPAAQGVDGSLMPLSVFLRDEYGNVTVKTDYASGAAEATELGFTVGALQPNRDRHTLAQYDLMGHALSTMDAEGHTRHSAYAANGQVARTEESFTDLDRALGTIYQEFEYDRLGRLVTTREPSSSNVLGTAGGGETRTDLSYNAFGEVRERKVNGNVIEFFEYDNAGRLWRTNSGDGVTRVMFYDVLGRNTAEVRSRGADFDETERGADLMSYASAAAVKADVLATQKLRYTLKQYDALGRMVMQTQPERSETQGGVVMRVQAGATGIVSQTRSYYNTHNDNYRFEGANEATLTWDALESLGAGDVKVELFYRANCFEPYSDSWEEKSLSREQVFSAEEAAKGVKMLWSDRPESLLEVHNFVVWKKDVDGTYRKVLDRPIGSKRYSVEVAVPADPTTAIRLETQPATGGGWTPQNGIRFGSVIRYELTQLGTSTFDYRVFYDRLDPVTGLLRPEAGSTGRILITDAPTLLAINVPIGFDQGGAAEGVLAWQKPPSGTTQLLNYREVGSGQWHPASVSGISASFDGFDTKILGRGDYEFELLWTPSGHAVPNAHATGTFQVRPAQAEQQPSGWPNVTGIEVSATTVSWDTQIEGMPIAGTPTFEWRLVSESDWQSRSDITIAGNRASLSIGDMPGGEYEFRVSYAANGARTALGLLTVSLADPIFQAAPDATVTNRVTLLSSGFAIDATGTTLSWANTGNNSQIEYRLRAADGQPGDGPWLSAQTVRNGTTGSVDISGVLPGRYEFRITSEEVGGATVTIGAGNLTIHANGAGISQPPTLSNTSVPGISGIQVSGQEISWNAVAGAAVHVEIRHAGMHTWDANFTPTTSGGKAKLQLAAIPPGEYELRISYVNGDALVAFDSRFVKIYPDPASGPAVLDHSISHVIAEFAWKDGGLEWRRPPFAAPNTALLQYRDAADPTQAWHSFGASSNGNTDRATLPAGLSGTISFRVTYSRNGVILAGGGGSAVLGGASPGIFAADAKVAGLALSTGRLQWNAGPAGTTSRLYVRDGASYRQVSGVTLANGVYSVALPATNATFQTFEYIVQHLDANGIVFALGAATVELPPTPTAAQASTFAIDSRITGIQADRLWLSWDGRSGTAKLVGRTANTSEDWTELEIKDLPGGRKGVDIAGRNGEFEWRLTYTDAKGVIAAMERGKVNVSSPQPVLENTSGSQITGFATGPGRITWTKADGEVTIQVRTVPGDGTWHPVRSSAIFTEGTLQGVDLSDSDASTLDVLVTYTSGGSITRLMRGTLTLPPMGMVNPANVGIAVHQPSTSQLSWTDLPAAGTPVFQYKLSTESNWRTDLLPGNPVDGKRSVSIATLNGTYDYRISYSSSGVIGALATGELVVNRPLPQLSATDGAVLKNLEVTATRWSWDRPAGAGIARYRPASGGAWSAGIAVQQDGNRDFIAPFTDTPGGYVYEVTYTEGAGTDAVATAFSTGTFVVPVPGKLGSVDRADIQGLTQSPGRMSWTPNATGTAKFAYRAVNNNGAWTPIEVKPFNDKHSVDLTGLNGAFDYRIFYELPDTTLVALDTGRMDTTTTAPVPSQGDSKLQGLSTATTGQFKWIKKAGTLKVEYREGTNAFAAVPPGSLIFGQTVGSSYDAVDLTKYGALNGEFRITYSSGGLVTSMAMGTITGGGAWTPPTTNASANVSGMNASATTLSWTSTGHTGSAKFFYRNVSGGGWTPGETPNGSSVDIASLSNISATYEYRIVYMDGSAVTALGTGRLTTTAATASLGSNWGGRVDFAALDRTKVSWTLPSGASGTPEVRVRRVNTSTWSDLLTLSSDQRSADISRLDSGAWEVRVAYSSGGRTTHLAVGSFTASAPTVTQQSGGNITGVTGAAGPKLVWNKMPTGSPVVEYWDGNTWVNVTTLPASVNPNESGTQGSCTFAQYANGSKYPFRIYYDNESGFVQGSIEFKGSTSAPLVTEQTNSFFGGSILSGLGELSWAPPANLSAWPNTTVGVEYRLTNVSTWTTHHTNYPVKSRDNGARQYIDVSSIGPGDYEFRIIYRRQPGNHVIAAARPQVRIHAAPSVVSTSLSLVGTFNLAQTTLSWTPPAIGGMPVFEYNTGGGWQQGQTVGGTASNPTVNIQNIYGQPVNFRVRYVSGGYDVGFGSGSFNATAASTSNHQVTASDVSGYRIESGKLVWNRPAAGGAAIFYWRSSSGGNWSSTEAPSDNFDLTKLSGGGSWAWRVVYSSSGGEVAFGSGTLIVPSAPLLPVTSKSDIGPVMAPANGTTLEWPQSTVTGATAATATFKIYSSAGAFLESRSVDAIAGGKHSASVRGYAGNYQFRIEYTVDGAVVGLASGTFTGSTSGSPVVSDTVRGEVEGVNTLGTSLRWTAPTVAGTARVYTKRAGDSVWIERGLSGGTSADLAALSNVAHEFRIVYTDSNNLVTAMAMGTLLPQAAQVLPDAATNVGGFQGDRTRLSWDRPAALAGFTELFEYFDANTGDWAPRAVLDLGGIRRGIDVAGLENVTYRYRVTYTDVSKDPDELKALGTGTFSVGVMSPPVLTPITSTVSQPVMRAGRLIWARPASAPANSVVVFERRVGANWSSAGITVSAHTEAGHDRIELSSLGAGNHDWRVKYTHPTTGLVLAIGSGTVSVPQAVSLDNRVLGNVTGIQADSMRLSWDPAPNSAGTVKAEYYEPTISDWIDVTHWITIGADGKPGVRIAGMVGTVDFRISYGETVDGQRRVLALGFGRVTGTAGSASREVVASPIGDFDILNGVLSWTSGSGTADVKRRKKDSADDWVSVGPVSSASGRDSIAIGVLDAGDHEYSVVYTNASGVSAAARVGVTVGGLVYAAQPHPQVASAASAVAGFTVPAGTTQVRWTAAVAGTATFEYRAINTTEWKTAPVGGYGAQHGVDIGALNLPQGPYEFRVQYRSGDGGDTVLMASGAGNFNVPAPVAGTQKPTLDVDAAPAVISGFAATPRSVSWTAPASGTALVETRAVNETTWSEIAATRSGANDGVSFNYVTQAASYEFRITYTDEAGKVTAIGSGVVNFAAATSTRPAPSVEVTTPPYVPGHAATLAQYLSQLTTATHASAISDDRLSLSATAQGGAAPGDYVLRPKIEQKLDRWGNVVETTDPRNAQWKTTYKWNWDNQLVEQVRPADESSGGAKATTRLYYDVMGRQVGIRDAEGYINRQYHDRAGNLVQELHADGGRVTFRYDAFGQKVRSTDAVGNQAQQPGEDAAKAEARRIGRTTDYRYDKMGRLLQVEHGEVNVYSVKQNDAEWWKLDVVAPVKRRVAETYTYDEVGRLRTRTNGDVDHTQPGWKPGEPGNGDETTRYNYDAAGHVVEVRDPLSRSTRYAYNEHGHKTSETDANGKQQQWVTDAFGRVQSHTDLSGVTVKYEYDNAKLLQSMSTVSGTHVVNGQAVASQNQTYRYDGAGQLLQINDAAVGRTTSYKYDAAGNRVAERTEQTVGATKLLLQDNHLAYDVLGRLRHASDGRLRIGIGYDLNGNRETITTQLSVLDPATGKEVVHNSARHFEYDAMNRQRVVQEYDEDKGVVTHTIEYNLDGTRKSDSFWGNKVVMSGGQTVTITVSNDSGEYSYESQTPIMYDRVQGMVTEEYEYDNLGRLQSVVRDGTQVDLRKYDGAGRALVTGSTGKVPTGYVEKLNEDVAAGKTIGLERRVSWYDATGKLLMQNVHGNDGGFKYGTDYLAADSYDAAGNVLTYRQHVPGAGTDTHTNALAAFDGYVQATQTVRDPKNKTATSTLQYDANGHLKSVTDGGNSANNREIYSDVAGRALLVNQGGKLLRQLVANGEVLGSYGVGLNEITPKDGQRNPVFDSQVNFEWGYQQINGNYPGASPGSYTVREGDTLQGIARGAYGDSRMWYRIAEANGVQSDSDLRVGQTLVIPAGVGGVHNASDTFEPYDPSKVIGDTSPTLPMPEKGGCGALGQIIMVVVAIVVTFFTAGAAAMYFGVAMGQLSVASVAIAAGAAAVGSIASQGVGIAIGAQEKFSWKQVGIAALSAGVTQGITPGSIVNVPNAADIPTRIVQGAAANAMTQGIAVATGLQDKFSWRNVAASAVGTGVGAAVGPAFGAAFGGSPLGQFGARLATGLVAGTAAAAMRGGKVTIQQVATDAFGNALGNAVVDGMTSDRDPSNSNYRNEFDRESDSYVAPVPVAGGGLRFGGPASGTLRFSDSTLAQWSSESDRRIRAEPYMTLDDVPDMYPGHQVAGPGGIPSSQGVSAIDPRYEGRLASVLSTNTANSTDDFTTRRHLAALDAKITALSGRIDGLYGNDAGLRGALAAERDMYERAKAITLGSTPMERAETLAVGKVLGLAPSMDAAEARSLIDQWRDRRLDSSNPLHREVHAALLDPRVTRGLLGVDLLGYDGGNGPGGVLNLPRGLAAPAREVSYVGRTGFGSAGIDAATRVGVPVTRSTNPLSPVREFDAFGNEITYRTMSPEQAIQFERTGRLPPTTETSTAASLEYASGKYTERGGITFRLTTKPGTSAQLQEIGIAAPGLAPAEFPGMSTRTGPWMQTSARFKVEGGQMTTQLGQGRALDIFNQNLIDFNRVPKGPR